VSNPSADSKTFVVTFTGQDLIGSSLPDGLYDLTLSGPGITAQAPFAQPLSNANQTFHFYRLYGDANGDGAVDAADGLGRRSHRAAAARELYEEAGVGGIEPEELVAFSRWITPAELPVRFDTHFFLAAMPAGQTPTVDGSECVDVGWFSPAGAPAALPRACSIARSRGASCGSGRSSYELATTSTRKPSDVSNSRRRGDALAPRTPQASRRDARRGWRRDREDGQGGIR